MPLRSRAVAAFALLVSSVTPLSMAEVTPPTRVIPMQSYCAPPLQLSSMDGEPFDLYEHRGQWAFVHFWASWCGPCRKELPTIASLQQAFADVPLTIVLINTAEDEDTIFQFLASVGIEADTLMDHDGLVTQQWQPRGLPATFLVDPKGLVRFVALGGRPWDDPAYQDYLKQLVRIDPPGEACPAPPKVSEPANPR